jgi:DNA/RNA-binding domain of Phe-tRNA-synthetase-like protein
MTAHTGFPARDIAVAPDVAGAFGNVSVLGVTAEVGDGAAIAAEVEARWTAQHERWFGAERGRIRSHPAVDAYRQFSRRIGVDPDKQAPSIQALIERGLRNKPLGGWPHINPAVDAVNVTAVSTMIALGVFDADKLTGSVRLALSSGGERFRPLGASDDQELDGGRLILADDARVLSLFAYRDGVHQAVQPDTRRVLLLACVVDGIDRTVAADSLREAAELLARA